jgi:hypothetical protein
MAAGAVPARESEVSLKRFTCGLRQRRVLVPALLLGLASLAISVSSATAGGVTPDAVIKAKGGERNLHWAGDTTIPANGTLKVSNPSGVFHVFTLVDQSDVPKSPSAQKHCFDKPAGQHICRLVFKFFKQDGFPKILDTNSDGFNDEFSTATDSPGDALQLRNKAREVQLTAAPTTTLHYICIIHPWMHGKLTVEP